MPADLDRYATAHLNAHCRAAAVVVAFLEGQRLTMREIAQLTRQTPQGARKMMDALGRLPIVQGDDGRWCLFEG